MSPSTPVPLFVVNAGRCREVGTATLGSRTATTTTMTDGSAIPDGASLRLLFALGTKTLACALLYVAPNTAN